MSLRRHAFLFSLALAACAPAGQQWEKAGATEATAREELEQCRQAARFAPMPTPTGVLPPPSTATTTRALTPEEEFALNEAEAFQRCIHDKGYRARC